MILNTLTRQCVALCASVTILLAPIPSFSEVKLECPSGTERKQEFSQEEGQNLHFCARKSESGEEIPEGKLIGSDPTTGKVVQEFSFVGGKAHGEYLEYYPNGTIKKKAQQKEGKLDGPYRTFYDNGKKRVEGQYSADEPSGTWTYWNIAGKTLATGSYDLIVKQVKEDEKKQEQLDLATRRAAIKKVWQESKSGKITTFSDKKAKVTWSQWLGNADFYRAKLKCKNLGAGWRLPSDEEWQSASEHGSNEVFDSSNFPFWTSLDNTTVTDPGQSMILGDQNAFAITPDGQLYPNKKLGSEVGVRCVRR